MDIFGRETNVETGPVKSCAGAKDWQAALGMRMRRRISQINGWFRRLSKMSLVDFYLKTFNNSITDKGNYEWHFRPEFYIFVKIWPNLTPTKVNASHRKPNGAASWKTWVFVCTDLKTCSKDDNEMMMMMMMTLMLMMMALMMTMIRLK